MKIRASLPKGSVRVEWKIEYMYAGVCGQGAHDGANGTALICEIMYMLGIGSPGGAADLYK